MSQSLRVVLESIFEIQIRKEDGLYSLRVDPKFFWGDRCVCVEKSKRFECCECLGAPILINH